VVDGNTYISINY